MRFHSQFDRLLFWRSVAVEPRVGIIVARPDADGRELEADRRRAVFKWTMKPAGSLELRMLSDHRAALRLLAEACPDWSGGAWATSRGMILPLFATALIADVISSLACKEKLYHGLSWAFMPRK